MNKKCILLSLVAVAGWVLATGCSSTHTTTRLGTHRIKVVDCATTRPLAGARVELYGSGGCMGQATDEQGDMRVASGLLTVGTKYERIEVTRDGYQPVSFPLTNGLPRQVELTAIQSHK